MKRLLALSIVLLWFSSCGLFTLKEPYEKWAGLAVPTKAAI